MLKSKLKLTLFFVALTLSSFSFASIELYQNEMISIEKKYKSIEDYEESDLLNQKNESGKHEEQAFFENTSGVETINENLQQASINQLSKSGQWAFEFIWIDEKGQRKILSQYNIHQPLKPASTLKLFTGYLSFLNSTYPIENLATALHVSHNEMFESVLKSIANFQNENKDSKFKKSGLEILKNSFTDLEDSDKFNPVDGSGLSSSNKVTVHLETELLIKKILNSDRYNDFKLLLAHPKNQLCSFNTFKNQMGEKHDYHSTLESSFDELGSRIYAKTGTLNNTKALAGFVEIEGQGVIVFSIIGDFLNPVMENGKDKTASTAFAKIISVVQTHVNFVKSLK